MCGFGLFKSALENSETEVLDNVLIMLENNVNNYEKARLISLELIDALYMWHDQGEWAGCREYWFEF